MFKYKNYTPLTHFGTKVKLSNNDCIKGKIDLRTAPGRPVICLTTSGLMPTYSGEMTPSLKRSLLLKRCMQTRTLDFERACSLVYHLLQSEALNGDIVEFGTYKGTTAMLMTSLSNKKIWLYDSFSGLPEKHALDGFDRSFESGKFAVPVNILLDNFKQSSLQEPTVVKKWFNDLTDSDLPKRISFAHLDGDFYESIFKSISLVYPRMSKGGRIIIDDYNYKALPGVKAAVDEFMSDKQERIKCVRGSLKQADRDQKLNIKLMIHALIIKK
jgi:O-methyltransferase